MVQNFVKGVIVGITIIGAVWIFKETITLPLEIARNYKLLLLGEYSVREVGDAFFYGFWGYIVTLAIAFNLIPEKAE